MKYYRGYVETWSYKAGEQFYEFRDDNAPLRQVTHVDDRWLCSLDEYDDDVGLLLTDQPLQPGEFEPEHEITADEFEAAWQKALSQREQR
jgi:hypothetical protein